MENASEEPILRRAYDWMMYDWFLVMIYISTELRVIALKL